MTKGRGSDDEVVRRGDTLAAFLRGASGPDRDLADEDSPVEDLPRTANQLQSTFAEPDAAAGIAAERRRDPDGGGQDEGDAGRGEIVAVYSPKGGVGTSLLASRLALAVASSGPAGRTAVVDLNTVGSDLELLVGLPVSRSVAELMVRRRGRAPRPQEFAAAHPSGLAVLGAVLVDPLETPTPGRDDQTAVARIRRLFAALRDAYDLSIVDVPGGVDASTMTAISAADRTLLVTVPEEPCVRRTLRLVRSLGAHEFPMRQLGLLHNMDDGVNADPIAEALGVPLVGVVPFDPVAVRRLLNNDGMPATTDDPFGRAVVEVAGRLWRLPAPQGTGRPGRLGKGIGGGNGDGRPAARTAKTARTTSG